MKGLHRPWLWVLLVVVAVLVAMRIGLPHAMKQRINERLADLGPYRGHVADVHVALWRGAYRLDELVVTKKSGQVPVPFVAAHQFEIALDWSQLFRGKLIANATLREPHIHFVDGRTSESTQTGESATWRRYLDQLAPMPIRTVTLERGTLTFHRFDPEPPVELKLTGLHAKLGPLDGTSAEFLLDARADEARLEGRGRFDPHGKPDRFEIDLRLSNLDITRINPVVQAYYGIDFASGHGNLTAKFKAQDGRLSGYAEPRLDDLKIVSKAQDVDRQHDNPFHLLREAIAGAFTRIFKKEPDDRFAARIDIDEPLDLKEDDTFGALLEILRKGTAAAFRPSLGNIHRASD